MTSHPHRRFYWFGCALVLLGAMMVARPAHADSCAVSMPGIDFGSVSPISGNAVRTSTTLTVSCTWQYDTLTPQVLVCLNLTGTPRRLTNGSNSMQYDLYQDSGYNVQWGSTSAGTQPISVTLQKPVISGTITVNSTVTIYGQITSNQPLVPSVGNVDTAYTQVFTPAQAVMNVGFYLISLLASPSCAGNTSPAGSFGFTAKATVTNNCNISANDVAFSPASLLTSALNATGSLNVQCTNGDAYRVALNGGGSGNVNARQMTRQGGGGTVSYQLYTDAAHSTAWGDATGGSVASGTGTGAWQTINVYGVVPIQSTPQPGRYSDTITATITF
ncbi:Spore coat protein U (SCPU) domain-containing protein [Pararobbsia alpina]|uniref:Csu type fimbrial protein n=1 Tax=Pararobbsia alpina TaxID=621374 RepID=UPI0039A6D640